MRDGKAMKDLDKTPVTSGQQLQTNLAENERLTKDAKQALEAYSRLSAFFPDPVQTVRPTKYYCGVGAF